MDPLRFHTNTADDEKGSGGLWGNSEEGTHEHAEVAPVTWIIQELATRGSLLVSVAVRVVRGTVQSLRHCEGCQQSLLLGSRVFAGASVVPLLCGHSQCAARRCAEQLCQDLGLTTWGLRARQKAASSDTTQSPLMSWIALPAALSLTILGPGIHVLHHQITPDSVNPHALQAGVDKGWLLTEPSHFKGRPCMQRILRTAREVAEALRWLHSVGIVHGDLTGGNVLLDGTDCSPTEQDPRGFVAKVSSIEDPSAAAEWCGVQSPHSRTLEGFVAKVKHQLHMLNLTARQRRWMPPKARPSGL